MAKSDFVPTTDNDFLAWLDNFITQAEARRAELGLSEAALTALKAAGAEARAKSAANLQAQAAARHAAEEKKASRRAAESSARAIARQIKAGSGYSEALGALLGIVGPEDTTDLASLKPVLTGTDQTGGGGSAELPEAAHRWYQHLRDGRGDRQVCLPGPRYRRPIHRQPPLARPNQAGVAPLYRGLCRRR